MFFSRHPLAAALIAGTVAATSGGAIAEEGTPAEESPWSADVALGLTLERGNTATNALNATANVAYDGVNWRHTAKAEAYNEEEELPSSVPPFESSYQRTDESYYGSYKADRKLGENSRNYFFNVLTYEKDTFSGFQYQATYALGLGRRFIETERHKLEAEAGPGYRWICLEPETDYFDCREDNNQSIIRLAGKYVWKINDNVDFRQEIATDIGNDSNSTRAESVLNSKITDALSVRIRYLLEHESEVMSGVKESDHLFTVGFAYKF